MSIKANLSVFLIDGASQKSKLTNIIVIECYNSYCFHKESIAIFQLIIAPNLKKNLYLPIHWILFGSNIS